MSNFVDFELPDTLDEDIAEDFLLSTKESIESIEHDLVILERDPKDANTIHAIFRTLHTLKGNCRMCFLTPLSEFIHTLEDVFSAVRAAEIGFSSMLKEALLLALDLFKVCTEQLFKFEKLDACLVEKLHSQEEKYLRLKSASAQEIDRTAAQVIKEVAGDEIEGIPITHPQDTAGITAGQHEEHKTRPESKSTNSEESDKDLGFFNVMSRFIDDRTPYWENRSQQLLSLGLAINRKLTPPLDETQLKAAIYLHDIGMTFISDSILQKQSKLNPMEEKSMKVHPLLGYEWLNRIPGWGDAATYIFQHHERPDGQGYPNKLVDNQISTGAKILAVIDSFYSMINQRSDRNYKRSLIRAIKEINAYSGSQFDYEVVMAFNEVMRERVTKKNSQSSDN